MSYTDKCQDYIRDVPFEIGRRFFPPPVIKLPVIPMPKLNDIPLDYKFEAEHRARKAYEEKDLRPISLVPSTSQESSTEAESTLSTSGNTLTPVMNFTTEVLQPSRTAVFPITSNNVPTSNAASQNNHFADFESTGDTVFDELEWKTIDDKAALSQVLSGFSLAASNNRTTPPNTVPLCLPSNEVKLNLSNGNSTVTFTRSTTPSGSQTPGTPASLFGLSGASGNFANTNTSTQSQHAQLRARLLTKGYRENIVNVAFDRLPKDKMGLIEYYMKGMRTLEKVNVNPTQTIEFLVGCNLQDKQLVVDYATIASQLVTMGFSAEVSFNATRSANGDRVKALDMILSK